jgi:hypothetical protein
VTSVPYSAVTIDGAGVGNSGRAFTVAAGSHRVGLRTTDGRTREATVVVAPGKVASFCWDFDAEAECS